MVTQPIQTPPPAGPDSMIGAHFLLFFSICAYAVWTLYVWINYALGASYNDLRSYAPLLPFAMVALGPFAWHLAKQFARDLSIPLAAPQTTLGPSRPRLLLLAVSLMLFAAALLQTLFKPDSRYLWEWMLLAASSILIYLAAQPSPAFLRRTTNLETSPRGAFGGPPPPVFGGFFLPYLVCVLGLAALYLLGIHPDADDTHFLGSAVGMLHSPDQALWSTDPFFGIAGMPDYVSRLNIGEGLALVSVLLYDLTGLSHLFIYYTVLPLLTTALLPLPIFLLTRAFFPRYAWAGVFFAFALLAIWSTDNHAHGHFFLPRLYHGKSVFVSLLIPAIYYITRGLAQRPSLGRALLLCLTFIASGGFTTSGLYLALVAGGLSWLAFARPPLLNLVRAAALFLLATLPNLAMLHLVARGVLDIPHARAAGAATATAAAAATVAGATVKEVKDLFWTFGGTIDIVGILFTVWFGMLVTTALAWRDVRAHELRRLWLLLTVVALSPPIGALLKSLTSIGNLDWRWYWVFHLGVLWSFTAAASLQAGAQLVAARQSGPNAWASRLTAQAQTLAASGLLAIVLAFLALNWNYLSHKYATHPYYLKVYDKQLAVVRHLQAFDLKGRLILADERVTQLLPRTLQGAYFISPNSGYFSMPYFPAPEAADRRALRNLVSGPTPLDAPGLARLTTAIETRKIEVLVLDTAIANPAQLEEIQRTTGMACHNASGWSLCLDPTVTERPTGPTHPDATKTWPMAMNGRPSAEAPAADGRPATGSAAPSPGR